MAPWKGQRVCCFPFIGKADRCITQRSAPSLPQPAGQTASPRSCLGFHLCTSQTLGKGWEPARCPVSISFPPLQQTYASKCACDRQMLTGFQKSPQGPETFLSPSVLRSQNHAQRECLGELSYGRNSKK